MAKRSRNAPAPEQVVDEGSPQGDNLGENLGENLGDAPNEALNGELLPPEDQGEPVGESGELVSEGEQQPEQQPEPETNPRATVGGNDAERSRREFMKRVQKYADAAGRGEQSLPALAMDAVRMAADGIIGIEKPAAGQQDDATRVYTMFQQRRAHARGAVYEKESSFTQQVSKFRQIVVLGATLFDDGVTVLQRAADLHAEAGNDEARRGDMRTGTLYAFLVDIAREQNKEERKGVPITDEEISGLLFPGKPDKKSDIERVKAAIKALEKLRDGTKGDEGHKPMESEYLTASIANMYELLYELDPSLREEADRQQQLQLQAAALGFKLSKGVMKKAA